MASETRLREDMNEFTAEVKAGLAALRTEIKGDAEDLRADNRVLNDKLGRILEVFLAGKS